MAHKERKPKNDPGKYQADLLGNQLEQKSQSPRNRRGKSGAVHINGVSFVQDALFKGEEMRVPFPNAPVNKIPDRLGQTSEPGTLFSRPVPEPSSTQSTFFSAAGEPAEAASRPKKVRPNKRPDSTANTPGSRTTAARKRRG